LTRRDVTVAVGAQVMLTSNLSVAESLANGSRGVVTGYSKRRGFPLVRFRGGMEREMAPFTWSIQEGKARAHYKQVPLKLAFSLTIHKAQGITLDEAEVSLGWDVVEPGQAYVALSRVKSADGLHLSEYKREAVRADKRVQALYRRIDAEFHRSYELLPTEENAAWSTQRKADWVRSQLEPLLRAKAEHNTLAPYLRAKS
jgi:ATP-dependent DNA helicase PIF1